MSDSTASSFRPFLAKLAAINHLCQDPLISSVVAKQGFSFFIHFFFLFKIYLILVLAVLGLNGYVQAFSSCSEQGLLSGCSEWASHCGGFSWCRAQVLGCTGPGVDAHRLSCLMEPGVKSVFPCIARQILNHWTTREAPHSFFIYELKYIYKEIVSSTTLLL